MTLERTAICLAALIIASAYGGVALRAQSPIAGPATVVDGDTLHVAGVRVRLFGIDAPEGAQRCSDSLARQYDCGAVATAALTEEIDGKQVSCERRDTDRYGRTVAICSVDGHDLGEALVRRGLAVEYRRYSHGRYGAAVAEARSARRGLWAGDFQMPERWRQEHRR